MAEQEIAGQYLLEGEIAVVNGMVATPGVFFGAHVNLFKDSFNPTPESVLADFVAAVCDFGGYAAVAQTWSPAGLSTTGGARSVSNRAFFQATDAVTPNTAGGFFISSPAMPTLALAWGQFPGGIPLDSALAFVALTITVGPGGIVTVDVES